METYAIYQALCVFDQQQESGHRYTIFVDSAAAIDRARMDTIGPGQRFAVTIRGGLSGDAHQKSIFEFLYNSTPPQ